jgi:hypothetical protein
LRRDIIMKCNRKGGKDTVLESAEHLLLHVIGERNHILRSEARYLRTTLHSLAFEHDSNTRREYRPRYAEYVESLKRRVAGIEYRK